MNAPTLNPDWDSLPLFDRKGWRTMAFGEFAQNVNQRVEPTDAAEEIYVGLEHLDPGNLHIRRWGKGSDVIGTKLRFRKGDIIFGRRRAYQRKLAVAEMGGICSAHAMVVRAKPDIVLPEFLPFLMMSDKFMNRAIEISVGSLSPTINWTTLKLEKFTLPPLDMQRPIAEILWAVDKVVVSLAGLAERTDIVFRTHLKLAFDSKDTNKACPVRQTGFVQLGRQRAPKYQTGRFPKPYLRVANVFDGYLDYSDVLTMDFDDRDFQTYRLIKGDILLNEGQSRELVGRCAVFDGKIEDCCFQNTLIRYRAGNDVVPEYAFAFFQHCFHSGAFAAIARQTTSIAHLGADRFGSMTMPVPPLNEQRAIIAATDKCRSTQASIFSHQKCISELRERLINTIL